MEEKRKKIMLMVKLMLCIYNYIDPSLIYVGSTCQSLSKRPSKHHREVNSKKSQTMPLYVKMREIGKEQVYIELLEELPCENKDKLRAREGHFIRGKGTLNGRIEDRTHKERMEEQQEKWQEYRRKRWQDIREEATTFTNAIYL